MRGWSFLSPFPPQDRGWRDRWTRQLFEPWVRLGMRYYWSKTLAEDHGACERMQAYASQMTGAPILAKHEQRIAWFEEAYLQAMAAGPTPRETSA